ncbi:hypothetical protein LCGC14_0145600 [marine sediment metagenome]|uniref:Uncharacterized protein n=1 Tax=marine sediment metagenome TaxID=412755 RepID=A0A0F9XHA1_9ZZZZ
MTKLRMQLDVTYELNGVREENLKARLLSMVDRAIGDGLLTGDSPAEVTNWKIEIQNHDSFVDDTWDVDDVYEVADNHHIYITKDIAKRTIAMIAKHLDAEYGITWDTLWTNLDLLLEEYEFTIAMYPEGSTNPFNDAIKYWCGGDPRGWVDEERRCTVFNHKEKNHFTLPIIGNNNDHTYKGNVVVWVPREKIKEETSG